MSFLNSVLSTIGGEGKQLDLPQTQLQPRPKPQDEAKIFDSKPGTVVSQPDNTCVGRKRKAEDPLLSPDKKAPRIDQGQRQANGGSVMAAALPTKQIKGPSISTSKSALAVPYRGTSRPSPTSASPATPTTGTARPAPPKKGTYAEIMARAAANSKPQLGVIKHKPKDTVSAKKEIMMRKKGILPDGKAPKDVRNGKSSNSPVRSPADPKSPSVVGKKSLPQPSYKGTAAPKPQPTYKGTIKSGPSIANTARRKDSKNDRSRSNSINPRRSREYESEDEEDEVDEDDNGYSDESDNMEAGFSDVEEEETAAAKAARKEDEEQLRIENQLKKEKEDRKKRLAAMAAKAPKPKY
ncbi:MAG: hypothetical protein Q9182_005499 [Xanthomendoza sp. 2 TL-2023]